MQINVLCNPPGAIPWLRRGLTTKTMLVMKLTAIIILAATLHLTAGVTAQKVTYAGKSIPLQQLFSVIEQQTGYVFFYDKQDLSGTRPVSVNFKDADLTSALRQVLKEQPLSFYLENSTVFIVKKTPAGTDNTAVDALAPPIVIKGRVVDDKSGEPVADVTVMIKGTKTGSNTDRTGAFSFSYPGNGKMVLMVSHVGYETKEIVVEETSELVIRLTISDLSMANVEISTGVFKRKKESFTGATASFTGEQLKAIGTTNILQSLKTLDPSFIVVENNSLGSNPNTLPKIEVRGQTSIAGATLVDAFGNDPNAPLFILDGFETDIRTVVKLDMNRIASLTLLKDAASTALYGSKAANGVVVIETRRPKSGKIRVNYTADFRVEAPDFNGYNLMNAAEKLEFERKVGIYGMSPFQPLPDGNQLEMDSLYNVKLAIVKSGVNTNWLRVPTRTAFTNMHSLYVEGGAKELNFGLGLNYGNVNGVMKGSGTKNWGVNLDLSYRKDRLNVFNKIFVNGYDSKESPYGNFADYALANPYYQPRNTEGGIDKYLDNNFTYGGYNVPNPLYNGTLGNRDGTNNFAFQDNLQVRYMLNNDMALQGGLTVTKAGSTREAFIAPQDTRFDAAGVFEKGQYNNDRADQSGYIANLDYSYAKLIASRHQLTVNFRTQVEERRTSTYSTTAVGFPEGTTGDPAFAFGYAPYQKPGKTSAIYRRNTLIGSINYAYDRRYLLDATYNLDGSTAFGVNNKYHSFWSVGAGWNLHNEFALHSKSINLLKLRANIGLTGNQNLGSTSSVSVYGYESTTNVRGQGAYLQSLANPGLEWQGTLQSSVGADIALWNNRFSGTLNIFKKVTDPLVAVLDLPSSTGIAGYPSNVGKLTAKGAEAILRFSPVYQPAKEFVWNIGIQGSYTDLKYSGFDNKLSALNQKAELNSSLLRYKDGYSPNDIWAVRSLGIDSRTGNEFFESATNGEATFNYNVKDAVVVGSTRATVQGVISTNVNYKGFILGIYLRYSLGGDVYNSALYEKVENVSSEKLAQNQDKRGLYDRWFTPGDIARYRVVYFESYLSGAFTPPSSRFVQKNNFLSGESINIGYQPFDKQWVNRLGLESLRVTATMNDVFRISSIKSERGTAYPFANVVSFSLGASF